MAGRVARRAAARAAAVSLAVSCLPLHAAAATFRVLENSPLGIPVLHGEGEISAGDLRRLKSAVAEFRKRRSTAASVLSLHSPGGHVDEAVSIAYYLRSEGIGTVLLPTALCNSACALIFFGGYDAATAMPNG